MVITVVNANKALLHIDPRALITLSVNISAGGYPSVARSTVQSVQQNGQ